MLLLYHIYLFKLEMVYGVFRSKIFLDFHNVALLFVFDKYCPIMD